MNDTFGYGEDGYRWSTRNRGFDCSKTPKVHVDDIAQLSWEGKYQAEGRRRAQRAVRGPVLSHAVRTNECSDVSTQLLEKIDVW